MSCSASISRAVFASSAVCLALLGCAGSLDHPERFANLGQGPDAGPVNPPSDGGCDPVVDIFPLSCSTSSCHSAQSQQGNLDLDSLGLPNRLVGQTYERKRSNVSKTRPDASNAPSTAATKRSVSLGAEASSARESGRSRSRSRSPIPNASGSVVSTSAHVSGVATVARGRARSEYGAITVAMGLFLSQSTKTRSPRAATRNTVVSSSPCLAARSAANFCTVTASVSVEADGQIADTT